MSELMIYNQLVGSGLSPAGACGLMGNMKAESAMRSNNAQDGMTDMTDEVYTVSVDIGAYDNFVNDGVGYGLCQWTYPTRKSMLLSFAKDYGVGIGDMVMQLEFCVRELKDWYPGLWQYLCTTTDTYTAASRVCKEYEQPAVNNIDVRARFAAEFYTKYAGQQPTEHEPDAAPEAKPDKAKPSYYYNVRLPLLREGMKHSSVKALQELLIALGYLATEADGEYGVYTRNAVMGFQADHGLGADGECGGLTWAELINNYGG